MNWGELFEYGECLLFVALTLVLIFVLHVGC